MKEGLKQRIQEYLKKWYDYDPTAWVNGGEIERLAMETGRKASNASRRLRELANEGVVQRRENEKGHVEYKYNHFA